MSELITARKTYRTLDAWRGLASLYVVMFHTLGPWVGVNILLKDTLLFRVGLYGGMGIHVFFVVSGYCIASAACSSLRRKEALGAYLKARAWRIYPPMWCAALLMFALAAVAYKLAASGRIHESVTAQKDVLHQNIVYYFSNITLTQIAARQKFILDVAWTLCYEAAFYLVVGIALWLARRKSERVMFDLLHSVTFCNLVFLLALPRWVSYPFDFWPEFGFGIMAFDILKNPAIPRLKIMFAAAGVLTMLFTLRVPGPFGYNGVAGGVPFCVALAVSVILLILYRYDETLSGMKIVRALSWVGTFSYSLYLTHLLPLTILLQVFKKIVPLQNQPALCLLVSVAASIIVGRLFYQFCERPFLTRAAISRQNSSVFPLPVALSSNSSEQAVTLELDKAKPHG